MYIVSPRFSTPGVSSSPEGARELDCEESRPKCHADVTPLALGHFCEPRGRPCYGEAPAKQKKQGYLTRPRALWENGVRSIWCVHNDLESKD